MAKIAYEDPDGTVEVDADADRISDSGKVQGIRIKLDDGSYLHLPYARVYWVKTSEEEGKVDYSSV